MRSDIQIGGHVVGNYHPCYVIAEAGVNHNGSLAMAKQLVDAAVEAGADAVKFQTFKAENVASKGAPKAVYQLATTDSEESQVEMLQRLELTLENFRELKAYCELMGLMFLSTPHDWQSIDTLEALDVLAYKIGSGDATNLPFLREVSSKGKPILLSTGMCTLGEVETALFAIHDQGNDQVVLLHCVSNYPAAIEDSNLRAIRTLRSAFQVPVGFSDHTTNGEVVLAAVALGACVIEKHFTLDRTMPGPDHAASAEPNELALLVAGIRAVERALGNGLKQPTANELMNREAIRKSIVTNQIIPAGATILREMLAAKRPGTGLAPGLMDEVIGKKSRVRIDRDMQVNRGMLDG